MRPKVSPSLLLPFLTAIAACISSDFQAFAQEDAGEVPVVGLKYQLPPVGPRNPDIYSDPALDALSIEIVRQAMLLTARESFGAATRDESLREDLPELTLVAEVRSYWRRTEFELMQGETLLSKGTYRHKPSPEMVDYLKIVEQAEEGSRTTFVESWKQVGLTPIEQRTSEAEVPEDVENLLLTMDAEAQLAAVMKLHALIREQGESPALVAALARGYSHLSQLTLFLHSQMRPVFGARALLYATRLIKADSESPLGHWTRAYVYAVLCLPGASGHDLELAEQMESDIPEPDYLTLIRHANNFDYKALREMTEKGGPAKQLCALLCYRSVEFSGSNVLNIETGKFALQHAPSCLRIVHGMDRAAGVGLGHQTSTMCVGLYTSSLARELPRFGALLDKEYHKAPSNPDPAAVHQFATLLMDEYQGSTQEPSLEILGRLIEETNFLHLQMRVTFMRDSLGIDVGAFLDGYHAAWSDHPFGPLLNSCRLRQRVRAELYEEFVGDLQLSMCDYHSTSQKLLKRMPKETKLAFSTRGDISGRVWRMKTREEPDVSYDFRNYLDSSGFRYLNEREFGMKHMTLRHVLLIRHNWPKIKSRVDDEWLERYASHPAIALELGKVYDAAGDLTEAKEFYKTAVEAAPEWVTYRKLMLIHYKLDESDEAVARANEFMQQPDYGLDHANCAMYTARSLMEEGRNELAEPWAQRAAQSGSAWGMRTLSDFYEVTDEYGQAMKIREQIRDRYNSYEQFYQFVARTGRGDARQAFEDHYRALLRRYDKNSEPVKLALALDLARRKKWKEAGEVEQEAFALSKNPFKSIGAATMAALAGDKKTRDDWLQKTANETEPSEDTDYAMVPIKTAKAIVKAQQTGRIDEEEVDAIAPGWYYIGYANVHFYVGAYLESEGETEAAIEHYKKAASPLTRTNKASVIVAWQRLQDLGVDPTKLQFHHISLISEAKLDTDKLNQRLAAEEAAKAKQAESQ